jgi:hypothetical protein
MFLIALSSIALAVLLALGPLFVALLFFDATRRLFVAWVAQLTNYALITVLTVMVAALLLRIVQSYAAQTAARGPDIVVVDALHMILVSVLVLLILRQVMPIASGLAGGVSLNSFGLASRSVGWGISGAVLGGKAALAVVSREREKRDGADSEPKLTVGGNASTGVRVRSSVRADASNLGPTGIGADAGSGDAGAADAALGQNWRQPGH